MALKITCKREVLSSIPGQKIFMFIKRQVQHSRAHPETELPGGLGWESHKFEATPGNSVGEQKFSMCQALGSILTTGRKGWGQKRPATEQEKVCVVHQLDKDSGLQSVKSFYLTLRKRDTR